MNPLQLPDLAIYVHFPWCVRKCPYCDFNSHEAGGALPEDEYVKALEADLQQDLDNVAQREISSVFLGGGTPSLFSPRAIGDVLAMVDRRVGFARDVEVTMEANPGTTEQGRFEGYRQAGVNRLSIGVQSFDNTQLTHLGRIHDSSEALRAYESARAAGFDNINLDLMHGLPRQTLERAMADVQTAIDLGPEHISWYQLTLEPNTVFFKHPPELPDEDTLADIDVAGEQRLAEAGYDRYEVSAYAKPRQASRHNLNYWQFGDYLGIGAGAHGKLTLPPADVVRTTRTRMPRDYLASPARKAQSIKPEERRLEFLMNALRLRHGFPRQAFTERTGLPPANLDGFLEEATRRGLLEFTGDMIRPTERGFRFLNDLLLLAE